MGVLPDSLSSALSRSDLLRTLLPAAAFATSFRVGAAVAVINQPRLPPLQGPFEHVGVRYARCGGARVKIFYPAEAPSAESAPYCTDGRTTSDGMAGLVGFKQAGLSFLLGHLADAPSGCWLDAPPASGDTRLPLYVYSHGFGGNMDMASYMMRAFAAHGIVVAALEHTDGTASHTQLADGTELPFSPGLLTRDAQLKRRAAEMLAAARPEALGLDASRVGDVFLGGHSYGGPAALLAAASAAGAQPAVDVKGLVLHDPALGMDAGLWAVRRTAARQDVPTLSYVSDEYDRAGVRCGAATLHTIGGFHGNFVDAPLWAPYWVMGPLSTVIPAAGPCDAATMHTVLARTAKLFMDATSSGGETPPTSALLAASEVGGEPSGVAPPGFSRLLELRGGLCAPSGGTPAELLTTWRNERLTRFAKSFDGSRYHTQVLFVDDDGARARTCEALLERVAMWADAGWWLYPFSASTSANVDDGQAAPPSLLQTADALGLCRSRLTARSATLDETDLLSYDLIVCVDLAVLEDVRRLARAACGDDDAGFDDAAIVCLTDFLAGGSGARAGLDGDRMEALDDSMRDFLAPHYAAATRLVELPSVYPSESAAWEEAVAACALCCAGITGFLKERHDAYFVDAFNELLGAHWGSREAAAAVSFDEAEAILRRHIVTGGLDIRLRRKLFEEHVARLTV